MSDRYYIKNKKKILIRAKIRYKQNRKEILEKMEIYRKQNKEKISKQRKEHYKKVRKIKLQQDKEYYQKNKCKILKMRQKYRDSHRKQLSKYFKKHYQMIKEVINAHYKKRRQEDAKFRIICNLRIRLWKVLKGIKKSQSTMKLLGCSVKQFKQYIEKQFTKGMNWQNYGKWHIDHIKPCCRFDLTKLSEQRKCFNYRNLQPLWAIDNLRKNKQ